MASILSKHKDANTDPYTNGASFKPLFNTEEGIIIAIYNYKSYDLNAALPWSEITYQTYLRLLQPGQSISNLKSVVRYNVLN
ncbi:MAG: hypothetical protein L6R38_001691, partial [Xanthoria sp. 2 TBL-2021]